MKKCLMLFLFGFFTLMVFSQEKLTIPAFFDTLSYFPALEKYKAIVISKDPRIDFEIVNLRKSINVIDLNSDQPDKISEILEKHKKRFFLLAELVIKDTVNSSDSLWVYLKVQETTFRMFNGSLNLSTSGSVNGLMYTDCLKLFIYQEEKWHQTGPCFSLF